MYSTKAFSEIKDIEKKMSRLNARYNQLRVQMGLKTVRKFVVAKPEESDQPKTDIGHQYILATHPHNFGSKDTNH